MENPFLHYVDDFEKEAEAFLEKYACADAIENPRRIPILDIATRLMSLDVIQTESLSPDESVQGAIAFSKGVIDVYDWKTKEYMGFRVESPSIFVDSDIINVERPRNIWAFELRVHQYLWIRISSTSVGLITPWRMNVITGGGTETILTSKEFTNRALNLASVAISICGKMSKRVGGLTLSEWSGRRVQLLLKF